MTVFLVLLATGVILQVWSTSTTADVPLANFVQVNLGPLSAGQDVGVLALGLEVGVNVIYVPAATTVPMTLLTCREYLVTPHTIAQRVRHWSSFAQEEHIALVLLPHPYLAQVCAYTRIFDDVIIYMFLINIRLCAEKASRKILIDYKHLSQVKLLKRSNW